VEISEPRDTKVRRKVPLSHDRKEQTIDLPLEASSYKYISTRVQYDNNPSSLGTRP
jgi:hypothetical protein